MGESAFLAVVDRPYAIPAVSVQLVTARIARKTPAVAPPTIPQKLGLVVGRHIVDSNDGVGRPNVIVYHRTVTRARIGPQLIFEQLSP